MAGAGYKLFNTGDVLTAAQVNTYLQEQVVMVFANATARTTALTGVLAEGMMSYLQDTNAVEVYDGSSWVSVGSTGDITGITTGANSGLAGGVTSGTADLKLNFASKGQLAVGTGSGTTGFLNVGTNGHTLVADSAETTGLKWAAASSGALTKISRVDFSNVASQAFDGVFTSTYTAYIVVVETVSGNIGSDLRLQLQYSTNTVQSANYYAGNHFVNSSAAQTLGGDHNAAHITILKGLYSGETSSTSFYVTPAGNSSNRTTVYGQGMSNNNAAFYAFGGLAQAQTYTGFKIFSSSGNITGTVAIYGLAE